MRIATILSADDNEDDHFLIQRACRTNTESFRLKLVDDGQMAIDYLKGVDCQRDSEDFPRPILLLLDINMPRKNGFDVLDWLRQQPSLQQLPVAIFSSSQDKADIRRAYELGARWYMMKPVDYDEVERLARLIGEWVVNPAEMDLSKSPFYQAP